MTQALSFRSEKHAAGSLLKITEGSALKPAQLPDRVLLFDGVCNLCSGAVQFIIKRDPAGKISFASLQSDTARELLASEGLPTEQFDSMIFIENGRIYKNPQPC